MKKKGDRANLENGENIMDLIRSSDVLFILLIIMCTKSLLFFTINVETLNIFSFTNDFEYVETLDD